ncbi:AarF/ABC1/UbiB kinase family protein [soil metagenome]
MLFNQTFRNLGRTREIIQVLIKYGFEDIVTNSTLRNFVPEAGRLTWVRQDRPVFEYTRWERIRMVAEELGPTFVKLAQILSNRPDLLPEPLIKEFEKLQDKVPPFSYAKAKQIIESDSGKRLDEMFDYFSEKPLASASIGQVHRATLKDGTDVVVKVQRPEVKDTVERDLSILKEAVGRADRYLKRQGLLNAEDVVRAFERSMSKELDYRNEARNIERFRNMYKDYTNFYIPKVYKEYTTERMLVIEYVSGCKITDVAQIKAWGLSPKKVVENGMNIYLTMIFEHGHFHADPHPGNVLVDRSGIINLLDFGMVGRLEKHEKNAFAGIFISMAMQDAKGMASSMRKLAIEDNISDMRAFTNDLSELIEDYSMLDVSESNMAEMTGALQKIMFDYQMKVPGSVFLIFRALAILEGIGKTMYPDFKTYEFIKPYGARILKERLKPENLLDELNQRYHQLSAFFGNLPVEIKSLLQKAERGKLHFEIELQGYGYLLKKMDSIANRMSITLIICALLIGSAITMTVPFPAQWMSEYGMPLVSLGGLTIAGGLFLVLCYTIIRRRKYK